MRDRGGARGESGTAFYLLVVVSVITLASGILLQGRFRALLQERTTGRHSLAARWAAEGGVEKARAALAADPAWSGGAVDMGRGRAVVEVREILPGLREIVSIADFPVAAPDTIRARRRIRAVVRLGEGLPAVTSWAESPR